jgi:hypothetical protein
MSDFRSDPMPSAEGRGLARRAWESYSSGVNRVAVPLLGPLVRTVSANTVADLMGFWVLWHLHGGFEGLRELGMSRAAIYRKTALFRKLFGAHPDEFKMPGVSVDVDRYLTESKAWSEARAKGSS